MAKKNDVKNEAMKGLKAFIALLIVAIFAAGVCCLGFASRNAGGKWFKNFKNISDWHWSDKDGVGEDPSGKDPAEIENSANSVQLSDGESNGAKFSVRALRAAEYREYGIDTQSVDGAYLAVVTLANHNIATDKSLTLSASFASGESASEYIAFSSNTVQSGESFTITCTQAFNYQITITAEANGVKDGEKPKCTIKADYIRRFKGIKLMCGEIYMNSDGEYDEYFSYIPDLWLSSNGGTGSIYVEHNNTPQSSIFIRTDLNSTDAVSDGTITEGIKDVQIVCIAAGSDQDIDSGHAFENAEVLTNELENTSDKSYLFFYCDDSDYYVLLVDLLYQAQTYADGDYYSIKSKYDAGTPSCMIAVSFRGEISGILYTFWTNVIVNPEGLYVQAQSPTWNIGDVIF